MELCVKLELSRLDAAGWREIAPHHFIGMLRVACFAALAASASALVAPPARGAAALSSRLAPLEVQKGSIVRIMRPESCAAASETLRCWLRRRGFTRLASFRRRARQRWN